VKKTLTLITIALVALSLAACSKDDSAKPATKAPQASTPASNAAPAPAVKKSGGTSGTVTETMDSGGYTYIQLDSGTEKIWAAAPKFAVSVGDSVIIPDGMPMTNFHSDSLDRTFPSIYFVDSVMNASAPASTPLTGADKPQGHPAPAVSAADIDLSNIQKAEGGVTVGEVFSDKATLADKDVVLRGKVVKFSPQIMGKNWIHVQDGSGDAAAGTNDLTVTTNVTAKVGDTVLVTGSLTLDKDFGYGYKYNVIIEDAKVTVE